MPPSAHSATEGESPLGTG